MSLNTSIYQEEVQIEVKSIFGSQNSLHKVGDESAPLDWESEIVKAFLSDSDLQQITLISTTASKKF